MRVRIKVVDSEVTQPAGAADAARSGAGIARGAVLIAGLTIVSRILGLVRTLVFSQTIGATCLGTAYVTANQVPNLIYELVLGGALTSAMVPVLARSAERSGADPAEKARVGQITSALLTWSVVILVPLSLAIAVAAGPVATLLNPVNPNAHCPRADAVRANGFDGGTAQRFLRCQPEIIIGAEVDDFFAVEMSDGLLLALEHAQAEMQAFGLELGKLIMQIRKWIGGHGVPYFLFCGNSELRVCGAGATKTIVRARTYSLKRRARLSGPRRAPARASPW